MKKKHHQSNPVENAPGSADDAKANDTNDSSELLGEFEVVDVVDGATDRGEVDSSKLSPKAHIQSLQNKVASLEDSLLRQKAEMQNVQRRAAQQRQEAIRFANADLMRSMLTVVDDFQRSLEAVAGTDNATSVIDGVKLVYENFMKAMVAAGLESIEAVNQPFDPHVHEAMLQQPTDECAPGMVLEEITKGFKLHDRTLRPARVIVSKAVDETSPQASTTDE